MCRSRAEKPNNPRCPSCAAKAYGAKLSKYEVAFNKEKSYYEKYQEQLNRDPVTSRERTIHEQFKKRQEFTNERAEDLALAEQDVNMTRQAQNDRAQEIHQARLEGETLKAEALAALQPDLQEFIDGRDVSDYLEELAEQQGAKVAFDEAERLLEESIEDKLIEAHRVKAAEMERDLALQRYEEEQAALNEYMENNPSPDPAEIAKHRRRQMLFLGVAAVAGITILTAYASYRAVNNNQNSMMGQFGGSFIQALTNQGPAVLAGWWAGRKIDEIAEWKGEAERIAKERADEFEARKLAEIQKEYALADNLESIKEKKDLDEALKLRGERIRQAEKNRLVHEHLDSVQRRIDSMDPETRRLVLSQLEDPTFVSKVQDKISKKVPPRPTRTPVKPSQPRKPAPKRAKPSSESVVSTPEGILPF